MIKITPFQAAIGAQDERMWQIMLPYFRELGEDGQGEALKQLKQQFRDGSVKPPIYKTNLKERFPN